MSRTGPFRVIERAIALARLAEREGIGAREALERTRALDDPERRRFLGNVGKAAAVGAFAGLAGPARSASAKPARGGVGVVGAGMAGLACARALADVGVAVTLYEAAERVGGRCWTARDRFPGQVAERGAEVIDPAHRTVLGYARALGLSLEDAGASPGEVFYYFDGRHHPESVVIEEVRHLLSALVEDRRRLSGAVSAAAHAGHDRELDRISLEAYLDGANALGVPAGRIARRAIEAAATAEHGLSPGEQSCLNLLRSLPAARPPAAVLGGPRWHVSDGIDQITEGLARSLDGRIVRGAHLARVRRASDGRLELTFRRGASIRTRVHDLVVLALPFSTLRRVKLDDDLDLPPWKRRAIEELRYGAVARLAIGFTGVPWAEQGGNGGSFCDLESHQCAFEANPSRATTESAVLVATAAGDRAAGIEPARPQGAAKRLLADLDRVIPGAAARARHRGGDFLVDLTDWSSRPLARGSTACYGPGQHTTIAGHEATPVRNLHFAGEHTAPYALRGTLEGAARSGLRAAAEVLAAIGVPVDRARPSREPVGGC